MNFRNFVMVVIISSCFMGKLHAEDSPYVIGTLGDSISAGFNALKIGDNRDLNWSSGLDVNGQILSHAKRIQNKFNGSRKIEVHNEAFVGADSTQLLRQSRRLLRVKPDYVTIAIGANDVCSWFDDYEEKLAQYKITLKEAIGNLVTANANIKIVLVPVPSLKLMYDSGVHRPGCRAKWDVINICKPLLASDRTDEERSRVYDRQVELNLAIEALAGEFTQNVRFAEAIAHAPFDETLISSLDCFHPNIKGQNMFSELTFDDNWN